MSPGSNDKTLDFNRVKEEVKLIGFNTIRADDEDYFEAVVDSNKLADLNKGLEKIFGQPKWPAKGKLSASVLGTIKEFGGLRDDQTLYFCEEEGSVIFGMLWPWMDGEHITLKIGVK